MQGAAQRGFKDERLAWEGKVFPCGRAPSSVRSRVSADPFCGETPRLCRNSAERSGSMREPRREQAAMRRYPAPLKVFAAWRMLKARIESAASALTALRPLVRNLPPPDIRLMVPKGCATVHLRMVMRLGLVWMRSSIRSSAL